VVVVQTVQAREPLGFLFAGKAWGRHLSPPWTAVANLISFAGDPHRPDVGSPLDLVAVLGFVGLAAVAMARPSWPIEMRVFLALAVLLPLCSGTLQSGMRYMESAWPAFLIAADWLVKRSIRVTAVVVVGEVALTGIVLQRWASGLFVG
jgi:hypothetical protein